MNASWLMDVNAALQIFLTNLPASSQHLYVAYSGGLDSTVLLHALAQITAVQAIHIHHGLSPHADAWVRHCEHTCQILNVPFHIQRVAVHSLSGQSPEAAAREARYTAFQQFVPPHTTLALAHHADDQAETVLLQLLRGSGIKGLAAMPFFTSFHRGWLARPLLSLTRYQLETYAKAHALTWIDDESNDSLCFDRNYIRHQIMPLLTARWPGTLECLNRAASHCAEATQLNQSLAAMDYAVAVDLNDLTLNVALLNSLEESRCKNLIRYWLQQQSFLMPSTIKLKQIIQTVLQSRYDATPVVTWQQTEVRRFRHKLYAMKPLLPHDPAWKIEWDVSEDLVLPAEIGILKARDFVQLADGVALTVTFRQGGETLFIPGRAGHHSLKKLMQEWGIAPWLRDRVPFIYREGVLVAVKIF